MKTIKGPAVREARSALYVAFLTNTKGETKEMVKKNKTEDAFESYRKIISKGKNATAMNLITMRTRALRPQSATSVKDVEACIVKWKADIAYLTNVVEKDEFDCPYNIGREDKKSILVGMLPEALQLVMAPHAKTKNLSYESFEKELTDHIAFMDDQNKARRPLRAVIGGEQEASPKEEQEEWYDESGKKWHSMAVPGDEDGKKRKVEDPPEDTGKAKAKGSGQRPNSSSTPNSLPTSKTYS